MNNMLFDEFEKALEERMNQRRWIIYFDDDPFKRRYEIGTFKMLVKPYQY